MWLAEPTYGTSLLAALGVGNVVSGRGPYPELDLDEVVGLRPDLWSCRTSRTSSVSVTAEELSGWRPWCSSTARTWSGGACAPEGRWSAWRAVLA